MTGSVSSLLASATRPLAEDPGTRDHACGELMARITHATPKPGDDTLDQVAARLATHAPPPAWRLTTLFLATASIIIATLGRLAPPLVDEFEWIQGAPRTTTEQLEELVAATIESENLRNAYLAFSFERRQEHVLAYLRAASRQSPDNPAWNFEFAWNTFLHSGKLPPDFENTRQRLDPDNAAWVALEALASLETWQRPSSHAALLENDEHFKELVARAHGLLHQAAARKCWNTPIRQSRQELLGEIPLPSTVRESLLAQSVSRQLATNLGAFRHDFDSRWRKSFQGEVKRLVAAGDFDTLRQVTRDWGHVLELRLHDPGSFSQLPLWYDATLAIETAENAQVLRHACLGAMLDQEADRWERLEKAAVASCRALETTPPQDLLLGTSRRVSWHGIASVPGSLLVAGVTPADLTPSRAAEYAVADRFAAVVAALVSVIALLVSGFEAWRRGPLPNGLARALTPVFRISDHALVWLLGLALPVSWCGLVRLGPLGGRDIAINRVAEPDAVLWWQPWLTQTAATLVMAITLLVQTARWRWAKRGACLSLRPPHLWLGWTMAGLAAAAVPAAGAVRFGIGNPEWLVFAVSGCAGFALLWLLWRIAMTLFSPREGSLDGVLLCRSLVPAFAAAGLLALAAIPAFRHAEKRWVARDPLCLPAPDDRTMNRFEKRVGDTLRDRLLDALDNR